MAVADVAGEDMAAFAAVELGQDAPAERLVVAVVEEVDRLRGAPDVLKRLGEGGEVTGAAAQRVDELAGGRVPLKQAAGYAEQVVVVLLDERPVDLVAREAVQRAVVGGVQAPERGGAGVSEPRRVLIAKDPEQAEDHVGVPGGIGDDLPGPDARLGVEQPLEDVRGVGLGAGDHDRVQPTITASSAANRSSTTG